jgi:hypothetical protein
MPLVDVPLPPVPDRLPHPLRRFLAEADKRVDEMLKDALIPGFVPGDYEGLAKLLAALLDGPTLRGTCFCEWGSGLGVATGVAGLTGYDAYGIETEWPLVEAARQLADDFDVPAEFAHGSYIPPAGEEFVMKSGNYSWLHTDADHTYHDLGLDVDDFDVIYAYSWPDEEQVAADLFERYGGVGAILVSYRGGDGFRLRRKVERRGKRHGRP